MLIKQSVLILNSDASCNSPGMFIRYFLHPVGGTRVRIFISSNVPYTVGNQKLRLFMVLASWKKSQLLIIFSDRNFFGPNCKIRNFENILKMMLFSSLCLPIYLLFSRFITTINYFYHNLKKNLTFGHREFCEPIKSLNF